VDLKREGGGGGTSDKTQDAPGLFSGGRKKGMEREKRSCSRHKRRGKRREKPKQMKFANNSGKKTRSPALGENRKKKMSPRKEEYRESKKKKQSPGDTVKRICSKLKIGEIGNSRQRERIAFGGVSCVRDKRNRSGARRGETVWGGKVLHKKGEEMLEFKHGWSLRRSDAASNPSSIAINSGP